MSKTSINTNVKEFSDVQRALETIKSELDKLKEKSEVIPEEVEDETVGQVGSIRIIKNSDTESLFEIKDDEGWKKPMMGESQITLKKLTSNIKVVEKKSIDELETEDTNTDSNTAKKTIFDEKAGKFVLPRPDYESDWTDITVNTAYTFAHNLGTQIFKLVQIIFKDDSDRIWYPGVYMWDDSDTSNRGLCLWAKTDDIVEVGTQQHSVFAHGETSLTDNFDVNDGYIKVMLWK